MTAVAPGVRFNALAIFFTPCLSFAIDFNVRTSSLVQRRTTFFFLANFDSFFESRAFSTPFSFINPPRTLWQGHYAHPPTPDRR
jgi:hypothetical protein